MAECEVLHGQVGRDWAIAKIATAQRGVATSAQLIAAGVSRGAIVTRVRRCQLHRLHRGVYAAGHTCLSPLARETAALLAFGPGSVLSHLSAASLWRMVEGPPLGEDVTCAGHGGRRPGIRCHRVRMLEYCDVTVRYGLPLTTPVRTLLDLADVLDAGDLADVVERAQVLRLVSASGLDAVRQRARGRRGVAKLRALLNAPVLTRSEAERRMINLVRSARLPSPAANARIGGHEVDLVWRHDRLVVEVDGYAFHATRAAFERDRVRDAELQAAGYRVIRVTWRQIAEEPAAVVARLAQVLNSGWR
ncbi:MAG: DUF559 domain-containing protein [Solirubrobacteraceae bacterium]|nr:MAG: hypothetical protein DLM63_08605 [Solirubrobacterales bacterium]